MSKKPAKSTIKRKRGKGLLRDRVMGGLLRRRKRKKAQSIRQRCVAFFTRYPSLAGIALACMCGVVIAIGAWLGQGDRGDLSQDMARYLYEPPATRVEVDDPVAIMIENIRAGRRPTDSLVYEEDTGPSLVIPSPLLGVSPLTEPEARADVWRVPPDLPPSLVTKEKKEAVAPKVAAHRSSPSQKKIPAVRQPAKESAGASKVLSGKALAHNKIVLMAVVIDDMGVDRSRTRRVMSLPGPLTVSFLTFARHLQRQAQRASSEGHEVMLHVPMEPRGNVSPGPDALLVKMTAEEITKRSHDLLGRMTGFVGVNNHQGSRFTENEAALRPFMKVLKKKKLFFLDSKTTGRSVGKKVARDVGVRYVERHVFLDHEPNASFVHKQLAFAERIARRHGYAIVIGHPKDVTINALHEWLPQLADKGIALVPVSTLVSMRHGIPAHAENATRP